LGAGALAGVGPAAHAAETTGRPAPALLLYGTDLCSVGPPGKAAGDQVTLRGQLSATPTGNTRGEVFCSGTVLAPVRLFQPQLGTYETHLFVLPEGSLAGAGTVHHDGSGSFVLTGGTGAYGHARGSYTVRLTPGPGDRKTAEYVFAFTDMEVPSDGH
jgi:hypothetical protein